MKVHGIAIAVSTCQMYRNVNCTFHMKFEHSSNRERINIVLAYIQSLDNLYTFVSLMHVCMFAIKFE